tara:strand:- start:271 stop:552 length:282 start_codon:yes stop_codon:yes gene_type:complete
MSWVILKHWLAKSWVWTKTHWCAGVLLIAGFFLYKFFLYQKEEGKTFADVFNRRLSKGREEMEALEKRQAEEIRRIKEEEKAHKEIVKVVGAE